ncbi:hypothetical protein IAD21_02652 [Abditibacteriota bacterium]|nr:hypothetical protein IAD21_02652 [Abditibacteriota bacterium]
MSAPRILFASLVFAAPALAAPNGKLGFIGAKGTQILNLQSGVVRALPQGTKATLLTLSPKGTAVYFVPVLGAKAKDEQSDVPTNAMESLRPYSRVRPMPSLGTQIPYWYYWNSQGTSLYLSTDKAWGVFTPQTGRYTTLKIRQQSFDARDRKMAYSTENQIIVRDVASGRNHVLFDIRKSKPMFAALRTAKYPQKVKELVSPQNDPMVKDPHNWLMSDPALNPDGSRLYFACNAGTDSGAAGNTSFALFAVNLKTNKISVLSQLGILFGRMPHIFRVSSDGKRLLLASSVHDSAADNSSFVEVVDLLTQNSREVFMGVLPGSKDKANFLNSAVWSPDSKYIAVSGYFYDAQKMMQNYSGNWPEVKPSQYTTGIVDARTGRLIKTIKGATSLSWIK